MPIFINDLLNILRSKFLKYLRMITQSSLSCFNYNQGNYSPPFFDATLPSSNNERNDPLDWGSHCWPILFKLEIKKPSQVENMMSEPAGLNKFLFYCISYLAWVIWWSFVIWLKKVLGDLISSEAVDDIKSPRTYFRETVQYRLRRFESQDLFQNVNDKIYQELFPKIFDKGHWTLSEALLM